MRIFIFIINFFVVLLISYQLSAQKKDSIQIIKKDSTQIIKKDSLKKEKFSFKPSSFRIGLDVVPPAIMIFDKDITYFEVNGELWFANKYVLSLDFGTNSIERFEKKYKNSGWYVRIGVDYNRWHNKNQKSGGFFTVGVHYGYASFNHTLQYEINHPYWGNQNVNINESQLNASWLELAVSMKARLSKHLLIGPVVRWDFRIATTKNSFLKVNDIPGFGIFNDSRINLGYQLLFQIK